MHLDAHTANCISEFLAAVPTKGYPLEKDLIGPCHAVQIYTASVLGAQFLVIVECECVKRHNSSCPGGGGVVRISRRVSTVGAKRQYGRNESRETGGGVRVDPCRPGRRQQSVTVESRSPKQARGRCHIGEPGAARPDGREVGATTGSAKRGAGRVGFSPEQSRVPKQPGVTGRRRRRRGPKGAPRSGGQARTAPAATVAGTAVAGLVLV